MAETTVRNMRILVRRDDADQWTFNDPVLLKGEMGYEMDAEGLKFGDGVTRWQELPYFMGGFNGIDGGSPTLNKVAGYPTRWPWGNYEVVVG